MKKLEAICNLNDNIKSQSAQVIHPRGLSMTICACTHGYAFGYVLCRKAEKK